MTQFWLLAAALLLAGGSFFIPVFLRRTCSDPTQRSRWNLWIHQQRRRELAAEQLDGDQAAELTAELERDLLNDLDAATPAELKPASTGRRWLSAGLASAVVIGVALYIQLGRIDLLEAPPAASEAAAKPGDLAAGIEQLARRLAQNPNDLDGWVLLARSLQATGRADRAATAYEFAIKLAPDNLDLKALYAQTLAEVQQGSLQGKPAEIVAEVLREDPRHQTGLWLAGLAAAERREIPKAVEYWRTLKALLPSGSQDSQAIDNYIAQVQELPKTPQRPEPTRKTPAAGASIRVKVGLSDALRGRASPEDTVFVFARAASGPPMPLAVVRKKVKDLPVEVTLDDSMAMMPERKLSSFDQIVIGARISKSGQPMPSSGDLQGLSKPVPSQSTPTQTIEIREIVP